MQITSRPPIRRLPQGPGLTSKPTQEPSDRVLLGPGATIGGIVGASMGAGLGPILAMGSHAPLIFAAALGGVAGFAIGSQIGSLLDR